MLPSKGPIHHHNHCILFSLLKSSSISHLLTYRSQHFFANKGKAKQKNMCVSGYMLLTIRVGRSDYFFIFFNNFVCLKYVFIKTELLYIYIYFLSVTWCHGPLLLYFQWLTYNSLISSDRLSTARERYKNTFTKVIINIGCNRNRLETEKTFLREESVVKNQKRQ